MTPSMPIGKPDTEKYIVDITCTMCFYIFFMFITVHDFLMTQLHCTALHCIPLIPSCLFRSDLKPENIILDAQGHVRLCDYGFIKRIREDDGCFTLCGTPEYSAPEMILNTGHSFPVDFWSLGILIYEMVTGFTPFSCPDQSNATLFRKIVQGEFQAPAGVSAACCDLIRRLLVQDPLQRLGSGLGGVEEIMAHPWFDGVDWEAVAAKKLSMPFQPELSGRFDTSAFQVSSSCLHACMRSFSFLS